MHDTAYRIGGLVIQHYSPPKKAHILEIGSHNINGSLRSFATPSSEYVGMDFDAGPGVEIVLKPGEPWPVEDEYFDLVIASSVFEHDIAFWETFVAMCRKAKRGGFVYVSAPSNGKVHRFPKDYWRFYPDSGLALEMWAERAGVEVTLVESFIAEREGDEWNDYCAVFRREPCERPLPDNFIYPRVPCTNVLTWKSSEVLNERENTEDQLLVRREFQEVVRLRGDIEWLKSQREAEKQVAESAQNQLRTEVLDLQYRATEADAAATQARAAVEAMRQSLEQLSQQNEEAKAALANEREEHQRIAVLRDDSERRLAAVQSEMGALVHAMSDLRSELQQRNEEISQAWAELTTERQTRKVLEDEIVAHEAKVSALSAKLREEEKWVFSLSQTRANAELRIAELERSIEAQGRQEADKRRILEQALFKSQKNEERAQVSLELWRNTVRTLKARTKAAEEVALSTKMELKVQEQKADNLTAINEANLEDRFNEIAILTNLLIEREKSAEAFEGKSIWLRRVIQTMYRSVPWWWGMMPLDWRRKKMQRLMAAEGLFDAETYLRQYPDVVTSGQDPLRHYVVHGIEENRTF